MIFEYFDLLSGEFLLLPNVGYIKSPKLKEISKRGGIGIVNYNLYLSILDWNKETFLKYIQMIKVPGWEILKKNEDKLTIYDMMTLHEGLRATLLELMSFFIDGKITWVESQNKSDNKNNGKFHIENYNKEYIGDITSDNFELVCKAILEANYIGVSATQKEKDPKPTSKKAQERWDRAQEYLKTMPNNSKPDINKIKEMNIGNLISKLCASNIGYNILNIYELTIFQFYDQFLQYGYLKGDNLNERIFSFHGGESYNTENWLKPIINI